LGCTTQKSAPPPIIPDPNAVNFKPDANVEEVFGLSKPKENHNAPLTEEQQKSFEGWDWIAAEQELPEADPVKIAKFNKKKKKNRTTSKEAKLTKSRSKKGSQVDRNLEQTSENSEKQ